MTLDFFGWHPSIRCPFDWSWHFGNHKARSIIG
jgi:hypothetical protein